MAAVPEKQLTMEGECRAEEALCLQTQTSSGCFHAFLSPTVHCTVHQDRQLRRTRQLASAMRADRWTAMESSAPQGRAMAQTARIVSGIGGRCQEAAASSSPRITKKQAMRGLVVGNPGWAGAVVGGPPGCRVRSRGIYNNSRRVRQTWSTSASVRRLWNGRAIVRAATRSQIGN